MVSSYRTDYDRESYSSPSQLEMPKPIERPSGTCCCTARRAPGRLLLQRLAKASGFECTLMSGGDVGPLGADGVTALHTLFRWARTSETGVLVFIDEAEAFLASRSRAKLTEHMRNALNAFLYQTGSPTTSFVLVLATNRAEDLDEAVLDAS